MATETAAADSPDTKSLAHQRQAAAAQLVRTCYDGPLAVRAAARALLPQFPRESDDAYRDRLATSVFYDVVARTVRGLTGLVFRKPPRLDDALPEPLKELWENVDLRGTHGSVFARRLHRDGEIDGHFAIFVDLQRADPDAVRTLADERRAGLRPYWIALAKQDIYGYRYTTIDGRPVLTHLRFGETVTEPDGRYGEREVERVREYNLEAGRVAYTVHAKREGEWTVEASGEMSLDEIPLAVGYLGEEVGPLESRPPHLALALENVKHYQLVSDNDNVLHLASVPQLVVKGVDDLEATVGPLNGWLVPKDGDVYYAEPAGNGLEAAERRIQKSEQRMAFLGLSMLMSESRAAETATSKRIDKAETDSALATHARATQDALEDALRLSAKWLDLELPEAGEARWIAVNTDFDNLPLDAAVVRELGDMVRDNQLSLDTLWDMLAAGEILPATFDPKQERERLAAATPPGLPGSGMGSLAGVRIPGLEAGEGATP
jgi:hypothetical protein